MPFTRPATALALAASVCALLFAAPLAAQADKPKADLDEKDVGKLMPLYVAAMNGFTSDSRDGDVAAVNALKAAVEAWEGEKGVGSALADVDAWQTMFQSWYRGQFGRAPSGLGRVKKEEMGYRDKANVYLIEYAWYAPRNYDPSKAYPAILCFHDTGSNGAEYIDKVWLGDKESKDLAEEFIIIAPTIGSETPGGKWEKENATKEPYGWFTPRHLNAMVRPLKEIQSRFNIDPERIFIEGSGEGAAIALQLGALYGIETFAGIVARQGALKNALLVEGLENTPTLVVHRAPHDKEKDGAARATAHEAFRKLVEEKVSDVRTDADRQDARSAPANAEAGDAADQDAATPTPAGAEEKRFGTVTFVELPAPDKINPKIEAGQKTEPVMDANPRIAAFYADHRMIAYPARMHVVIDSRAFLSNSWFRISAHEPFSDEFPVLDLLVESDRKANEIKVTGQNLTKFTLYLNDAIVDLDAPVKVTVNGIDAAHLTVPRSLTTMLKQMSDKRLNTNRVVTAVTIVSVPEPEQPAAAEGDDAAAPAGDGAGNG